MPLGPISQNFWPEYNFNVFAWKLEDCIYSGPRNKWKNNLQPKKKKGLNFVQKFPWVLLAKNFWLEYNVNIFAQMEKYSAEKKKKKKKNSIRCCSKMPLGPISQEFWPEYNFSVFAWKLVDSICSGPRNKWKNHLQQKKKNKTRLNFVQNSPRSY